MGSAENLLRRVRDEIIGSKGARGISDFSHSRKVLRRYTEDGLKLEDWRDGCIVPIHNQDKPGWKNLLKMKHIWGVSLLALFTIFWVSYCVSVSGLPFVRAHNVQITSEDATAGSPVLPKPDPSHSICAVIPAKESDGIHAFMVASTILSSDSSNVRIILANNDKDNGGTTDEWLSSVASKLNKIYNNDCVDVANISRSDVDDAYPIFQDEFENGMDYGYMMADMLIETITPAECEYVMLANAHNMYHILLVPKLMEEIKTTGTDLIGWEYSSHKYTSISSAMDKTYHSGYGQQIYTQFKPGYIEQGGAIVKLSSFKSENMSFLKRSLDDSGSVKGGLHLDHSTIDAETFMEFNSRQAITSHVIERCFMFFSPE